jgi:hypothetical protein
MTQAAKSDRLDRMAEVLDDIDRHNIERKKWLDDWKLAHEVLLADLNMLREDVRQMRLDEVAE